MMPFTDELLGRLKESIAMAKQREGYPWHVWGPRLGSLVARLEAAERCLGRGTVYCAICCCDDCNSNIAAWEKSAGK